MSRYPVVPPMPGMTAEELTDRLLATPKTQPQEQPDPETST